MTGPGSSIKASLFVTCIVDQFYPHVGESTARVLDRLGVDLDIMQWIIWPPVEMLYNGIAVMVGLI